MGLSSSYLRMRLVCLAFEDAPNGDRNGVVFEENADVLYVCSLYLIAFCWFIRSFEISNKRFIKAVPMHTYIILK